MNLINLTLDPALFPKGDAIDLFNEILLASHIGCFDNGRKVRRLCYFENRDYRDRLYKHDNAHIHKGRNYMEFFMWNSDYLISQSVPVYIVNRAISGKYVTELMSGEKIRVPQSFMDSPKIPINDFSKESEGKFIYKDEYEEEIYVGLDENHVSKEEYVAEEKYIIEQKPCIDLLGCFTYLYDNGKLRPSIFIWMDKIIGAANNDTEVKWLFVKVLLHELAHAIMGYKDFMPGNENEYYYWREESLANAYALGKIKEYDKDSSFLAFAKMFVDSQPNNYKLGNIYNEIFSLTGIGWIIDDWMDQKAIIKTGGVPQIFIDKWLYYAKNATSLDEAKRLQFDRRMNNPQFYYKDELWKDEDFVFEIIKDYIKEKNCSLAELNKAFPTLSKNHDMFVQSNGLDIEFHGNYYDETLQSSDCSIAIYKNPDINSFFAKAKEHGFIVEMVKKSL